MTHVQFMRAQSASNWQLVTATDWRRPSSNQSGVTAPGNVKRPPPIRWSLELEQLGVRRSQADSSGREVNDHRDLVVNRANSAETVRVVADPIIHLEGFDGLDIGFHVEGAC
jgi:hypothetical protein